MADGTNDRAGLASAVQAAIDATGGGDTASLDATGAPDITTIRERSAAAAAAGPVHETSTRLRRVLVRKAGIGMVTTAQVSAMGHLFASWFVADGLPMRWEIHERA